MSDPSARRLFHWFQRTRVGRSIFRVGLPQSNLERAQAMVSSFLLHVQPAKVGRHALRPSTTLGLGLISLYLFFILIGTGVLLMFYYVPSTAHAYNGMKDLEFVVSAGLIVRNMHRWAAHLMVLFVMLHLCRVFYTAAYKPPREFNWVIGIGLLMMTLGLSFTGYLLPWDQLAFWAITVGTNIAGYAPVIGTKLQFLLLGGHMVGQEALTRFYALHVIVLPSLALLMISVHLFRVRKDGGLARPDEPANTVQQMEAGQLPTNKSYGLMELARGTTPQVGQNPEDEVFSWPHLVFRELLLFLQPSRRWSCSSPSFGTRRWRNSPIRSIRPIPRRHRGISSGCRNWSATRLSGAAWSSRALLVTALVLLPYLDRQRRGVGRWFAPRAEARHNAFHHRSHRRGRADHHRQRVPRPQLGVGQVPWKQSSTLTEGH